MVRRIAQFGLLARVVVYLVVAILCVDLAAGRPSPQADTQGAFQEIHRQPAGGVLLLVLACAISSLVLWRLHQCVFGSSRDHGTVLPRLGALAIAALYAVLLVNVIEVLAGGTQSGNAKAAPLAATVLRWPAGPALLGLGAVAIGIGAVSFAVWGATRNLGKVLHLERMGIRWRRTARVSSAVGDAGRGAVACLLAGTLFDAAVDGRPSAARSVGQSLAALRHLGAGPSLLVAIALSFVAFALFTTIELIEGRF